MTQCSTITLNIGGDHAVDAHVNYVDTANPTDLTERFQKVEFEDDLPVQFDANSTGENQRGCNVLVTTLQGKNNDNELDFHKLYAAPLSTDNINNYKSMINEIIDKFQSQSKYENSYCEHSSSTSVSASANSRYKLCNHCFQRSFFRSASNVIDQVGSNHPQTVQFRSVPPEDFTLVTGANIGPDLSYNKTHSSQSGYLVPPSVNESMRSRSRSKYAFSKLTPESRQQLQSMIGTATGTRGSAGI